LVGRIQTLTYDNQQVHRVYVTEFVSSNFQLLDSKAATESLAHADQSSTSTSTATYEQSDTATPNNKGLNSSQNQNGGQS
ncbi:single-stranded DNA-binding protein, partial [Enterococcus lactis]|uniref:single-stranded DNA-binding protein n=1 Tax=Enterococcus lactis TaxID=357441 RepID=UPI00390806F0